MSEVKAEEGEEHGESAEDTHQTDTKDGESAEDLVGVAPPGTKHRV